MVSDAAPISHGVSRSNVSGEVTSSRAAPAAPPATAATPSRTTDAPWPCSSTREPSIDPAVLEVSATVLVTFASTGGRPVASSAG